jgi:RNA polymerase sigma factor (sigma-70 family)
MNEPNPVFTIDQLLSEAQWLRGLARHLVNGDTSLADDAVQETWKSAITSPPKHGATSSRPWLAQVLRNAIRMRGRSDSRRAKREDAISGESSVVPPTDLMHERVELQRTLADRVLALEEPLRKTVLLRYYEDRNATEIAQLMDTLPGTVRSRLKVALDRLRIEMDQHTKGGRSRWMLILGPQVAGPITRDSGTPARLFPWSLKLAAVAFVGVAVLFLLGNPKRDAEPTTRRNARTQRQMASWIAELTPGDQTETASLSGYVRTETGAPVVGAVVSIAPVSKESIDNFKIPRDITSVVTGADGKFSRGDLPAGTYNVVAVAIGFLPEGQANVSVTGPTVLDLRLKQGPTILAAGRIVDVGGGPIEGANVDMRLAVGQSSGVNVPILMRVQSDTNGDFSFVTMAGMHALRAGASGYASRETWLSIRRDSVVEIALTPAARVGGVVLDARTRQPVPGAEVVLTSLVDHGDGTVRERLPIITDEQGLFIFDDVFPGRFRVFARYGTLTGTGVDVTVNPIDHAQIEIVVFPGLSVAGIVMDENDRPVGGASVHFAPMKFVGGQPTLHTTTDVSGNFKIDGVPPSSRYRAQALIGNFTSFANHIVSVSTTNVEGLRLAVERPVIIQGTVKDSFGKPAASMLVTAGSAKNEPGQQSYVGQSVITDVQGSFTLQISAGKIAVRIHDPSRGHVEEDLGLVPAGKTVQTSLALSREGSCSVSGSVLDDEGHGMVGVTLVAQGGSISVSTRSGAKGAFQLSGLKPGHVTLEVRYEEDQGYFGPWNWVTVPLALEVDERKTGVELRLPSRKQISGTVVLADGSPAPGLAVWAYLENDEMRAQTTASRRSLSRDDGSFVIEDLPRGRHTLLAMFPGLPDAELAGVDAGSSHNILKFSAGGSIAGAVVDQAGAPVSDFRFALEPTDSKSPRKERHDLIRSIHDPSGHFEVQHLPLGTYRVTASTVDGLLVKQTVDLNNKGLTDLRLVVNSPTAISGRVVDKDTGTGIQGARGTVSMDTGSISVAADDNGYIRLDKVPRGADMFINMGAPGFQNAFKRIFVPEAGDMTEPVIVKLAREDKRSP